MKLTRIGVFGVLALFGAAACADLDVENPNDPDTRRALASPGDVESLIGGSFRSWWEASDWWHSITFSTMSDAHSSSWGNFGMRELSSEPRIAIPNTTNWNYNYVLEDPWYSAYSSIKASVDGLNAIEDGLKITDESGKDQTPRAKAFAKFILGIGHGHLAAMFDQAFVYDETVDLETESLELQPAADVMAAAAGYLEEAAQIASSNSFTLPASWINEQPLSSAELARVAKSFQARYLASLARTPAERAAVNWGKILELTSDANVIQADFGPIGDGYNQWPSPYKYYGAQSTWSRLDLRTIGQADVSGEYEKWMATPVADRKPFVINSPDRRIMGAAGPKTSGTFAVYYATVPFVTARGTYHFSNYAGQGHLTEYLATQTGQMVTLSVAEMRLLRAEALARTGNNQGAADLINVTRVGKGKLPPVTAAGVPNDPATCVPQNADGSCGSLMEALYWEKLLETWHIDSGNVFFDRRGWGKLVSKTPLQWPIPAKELEVLQLPVYTFGGDKGGAAPFRGIAFGDAVGASAATPAALAERIKSHRSRVSTQTQ